MAKSTALRISPLCLILSRVRTAVVSHPDSPFLARTAMVSRSLTPVRPALATTGTQSADPSEQNDFPSQSEHWGSLVLAHERMNLNPTGLPLKVDETTEHYSPFNTTTRSAVCLIDGVIRNRSFPFFAQFQSYSASCRTSLLHCKGVLGLQHRLRQWYSGEVPPRPSF